MSLKSEENSSHSKAFESFDESQKSSKISYTRDFLLSLSELEICKQLPSEFDRSLLSEFEDFLLDIQERPRISQVPLQGFRLSEYGSSPPTKLESGNYSRGMYGRWDNRSSVRNDKESDSQSDWDSEFGKHYGNTSRRTWQGPDHDGLLGSGSFPRPSGYPTGIMAPRGRGDDQFQLKKSNEPYHPPRPYKAVPHTRREFNDSLNDETFGSSECSNEDRVEEERKRRASFELMRKEQQKVLRDKQKLHVDKHKDDILSEDNALLEQTKEGRALELSSELNESGVLSFPNNEFGYSSAASLISAPRPLVPPGFGNTVLQKNPGPKSFTYTLEKEIVKHELDEKIFPINAKQTEILTTQGQRVDGSSTAFSTEDEMVANPLSGLELANKKLGWDDHLYGSSALMQSSGEVTDNGDVIPIPTKKMIMDNIPGDSKQENTVSVLEKLLSSSLTVNTTSSFREPHDSKPDVSCSPNKIQSLKFARWFVEDEKKSTGDVSSGRPSDLLSLIVGGEKGGLQASNVKGSQHIPQEFTYHSLELTNRLASSLSSAATGISEQLYIDNKLDAVSEVLTCEDLEQKILSEYTENSSTLKPPVLDITLSDAEAEVSKASVDNQASVHLLSLLQKGTDLKEKDPTPSVEIGSSNTFFAPAVGNIGTSPEKPGHAKTETFQNAGKNITLESLFGSAFMKELQSVEAPVSVHRVLPGSARADLFEPHGLSFPMIDAGVVPSTFDEISSNKRNYENNAFASNSKQQTKSEQVENWLRFEDPKIEVGFPEFQSEGRLRHGFDGAAEIQLPEEESLFTVVSSSTSSSVAEKLSSLNAGYKDERSMRAQEGPQFICGPYDMMEPERRYQNLQAKASLPQFHPPNMSHGRPLFHAIDSHSSHITPQMKFIVPESIKHDVRSNSQIPGNMIRPPFHHPNTGPAGFDLPAHHQMLQQMQMSGFPPPNLLHEFPRGGSVPLRPSNQPNAFMPESSSMQGFPFSQRHRMLLPAPDVSGGSNHPEGLQRLIGMELRANPKPVHPFGGNNQGNYNHELDMGFLYR